MSDRLDSEETQGSAPRVDLAVDVDGGVLSGGRWLPPGADAADVPTVVAIHGITSNHLIWARIADHLAAEGVSVAAPDLRGRVRSAHTPGPYGLRRHAIDVRAVADALEIERLVLVGHSMGAWVSAVAAATWPDRVAGLVFVDGGLAVPLGDGVDPNTALDATLGPAIARLSRTYPSQQAYLAEWSKHPAFAAGIDRITRAYLLADLTGTGFAWRSSVREEAVRTDGTELIVDDEVRTAIDRARCPVTLVRAERGLLDQPDPLVPADLADEWASSRSSAEVVTVEGSNHYTLVLREPGATTVADAVAKTAQSAMAP